MRIGRIAVFPPDVGASVTNEASLEPRGSGGAPNKARLIVPMTPRPSTPARADTPISRPAFADVQRGHLRLLLSGLTSSAGRPMPDGRQPGPGGWNRMHLLVDDIVAEVARLRGAGVSFRNDVVTGPGGRQILLDDPSGNPIELFQPAAR
jgi:catechol 2,3-dioxygenase-like lactoylglutathione lyase family enzyme